MKKSKWPMIPMDDMSPPIDIAELKSRRFLTEPLSESGLPVYDEAFPSGEKTMKDNWDKLKRNPDGSPVPNRIALIDLDGTVADYDGQMREDLKKLESPEEGEYLSLGPGKHPDYIEARMKLIKKQPGWWKNLPELPRGMELVGFLRALGFSLHVLTKGPYNTTAAWTEKVEWVRKHIPDAQITITEQKGMVWGLLLVDDWPDYILPWLKHRPRGLVIMPAHPWNEGFTHPNVFRYTGAEVNEVIERMRDRALAAQEKTE